MSLPCRAEGLLLEAGPMFDPKKDSNQLKNPWDPRAAAPVRSSGPSATSMLLLGMEAMENRIPRRQSGHDSLEWWRARIAGWPYQSLGKDLAALWPKDSNGRASMAWVMIGRSDMRISGPITINRPAAGVFGTNEGLENDLTVFFCHRLNRACMTLHQEAGNSIGIPVIPSRMVHPDQTDQCQRAPGSIAAMRPELQGLWRFLASSCLVSGPEDRKCRPYHECHGPRSADGQGGPRHRVSYVNKTDMQEYRSMAEP